VGGHPPLFLPALLPGTPGPRGLPTRWRYRAHLASLRPNLRFFLPPFGLEPSDGLPMT